MCIVRSKVNGLVYILAKAFNWICAAKVTFGCDAWAITQYSCKVTTWIERLAAVLAMLYTKFIHRRTLKYSICVNAIDKCNHWHRMLKPLLQHKRPLWPVWAHKWADHQEVSVTNPVLSHQTYALITTFSPAVCRSYSCRWHWSWWSTSSVHIKIKLCERMGSRLSAIIHQRDTVLGRSPLTSSTAIAWRSITHNANRWPTC